MHHKQLLTWGIDGPLLDTLQALAQSRSCWQREVRKRRACLNLLLQSGPGVLVLKLGRDLEEELLLLEQVSRLFPEQATIVVSDVAHSALAALAWDLGASYVLFPPEPSSLLADMVQGFL